MTNTMDDAKKKLFDGLSPKEVAHLIKLPWSRSFQMTIKAIFIRFTRTVITASGIFLGIAFLASVFFQPQETKFLPVCKKTN